jgi:hypothetical protein
MKLPSEITDIGDSTLEQNIYPEEVGSYPDKFLFRVAVS